ncbi:hypothetical protein B4125_0937 [Bacillus paralicheniformis]|nr:hypothetical protein SC10_B2orf02139 [Bacillus paralicheniformis]OLG06756.1 hypothetical protein B4125_0937 [Bacillus paralicheniformis]TWJ58970.1 hypothetical protein CHCC5022_2792 [Bacillus paralicheniformis]TWK33467.1 hypothetical protein CHCC20372_0499 [Bacillus paralicheniformis]TWL51772.1 hypothetical protein CHCC15332_2686 [Bacillus paralicheniformis]
MMIRSSCPLHEMFVFVCPMCESSLETIDCRLEMPYPGTIT